MRISPSVPGVPLAGLHTHCSPRMDDIMLMASKILRSEKRKAVGSFAVQIPVLESAGTLERKLCSLHGEWDGEGGPWRIGLKHAVQLERKSLGCIEASAALSFLAVSWQGERGVGGILQQAERGALCSLP
eukprot:1149369-Pelagomonas_calceolata.AAC.1